MRIATPAFFCFPFVWNILSHPLIFSLYVSLSLKWVSYRQHIYGSCFCIHSVSLCLLVGAFNPFTLKVIIEIYVPIAIFLIVWGWFCRSFSSLVFVDYISPFNICCKAGLVVLYSLNFCLSEKLFISSSILNDIFDGCSHLGCRFFPFQCFKYILQFPSGLQSFCWKISCKRVGFPLYVTCCFSLAAFNILSLCLVFVSLISMCLAMFSLALSYIGLSVHLGLDWLFPFPCWRKFQL